LTFRLGSIPVRVQGWFLIMALLLGSTDPNPVRIGIWVAVVAVSVIIHELGHALVGRAFGLVPRIELHGMGGTTSFERPASPQGGPPRPLGTLKNVAISLAGPFAGFLFAGLVFAAEVAGLHTTHPLATHAIGLLFMVNVGWGVFNLVPMLPLDGGNVLRCVLLGIAPPAHKERADRIARILSIVVAAVIALLAVQRGQWWVLYLGVLFAFRNVQSLRQVGQQSRDHALAVAIEAAYRAYDRSAWREVTGLLEPFLAADTSLELRSLAVRICVSAMLEDERLPDALRVVRDHRSLIPSEELQRYAGKLREVGRAEDADLLDAAAVSTAPAEPQLRA
jgi:Zn-dependent protease